MLTDDDKKWMAARISASGNSVEVPWASFEQRIGARLEKLEATLINEFRKWALPTTDDPPVAFAALRTTDLELKALQGRVDKLEKG
jgi:hypothetical protein